MPTNDDTEFLLDSPYINWRHPDIVRQAESLNIADDIMATARNCFEWVRDEVQHTGDHQMGPVTCRASDVLQYRTGYCYAKSHLLAALCRANGIPAGLCYQRLSVGDEGPPYCLHGFNAIKLPRFGWYRVDARGNRPDVDAQFAPPVERLGFHCQSPQEVEFENVLAEPLQCVITALTTNKTWQEVASRLPDLTPEQFDAHALVVRADRR